MGDSTFGTAAQIGTTGKQEWQQKRYYEDRVKEYSATVGRPLPWMADYKLGSGEKWEDECYCIAKEIRIALGAPMRVFAWVGRAYDE